jgi:uncharacterized protein YcbX
MDAEPHVIERVLLTTGAETHVGGSRRPHPKAETTGRRHSTEASFERERHAPDGNVGKVSGSVAWISIAPVKGLGLVERESVELTEDGAVGNRVLHLIDDRGRLVNGKRHGPLVAVRPSLDAELLSLTFPDGSIVEGEVALGDTVESEFFGRVLPVRPVLGEFSAALSDHIGVGVRIVRPQGTALDRGRQGAISMLSESALNGFDPRRFRMLFGIGGVEAHAEDDWIGYRVRIGDAVVRPLSETGRCLVTSQDPDTGVPDMDMLSWIRANRPLGTGEPLPFGVHGAVVEPGTVRLGDPVALDA